MEDLTSKNNWFERLTGFTERSAQQVRENITLSGNKLISQVNGRQMVFGELETPSLADLRARVRTNGYKKAPISICEIVADAHALHADDANSGALFQAASQFNLLEMTSPDVTPERGVGIYEYDPTQGPACAIAAGAGTIYRNYFAPVHGQTGQSARRQIDCLADLGDTLGNTGNRLWEMRNGYALASRQGLETISKRLHASCESELDTLRGLLRIGLMWNTQVTIAASQHSVTQAYCSALPVAYSQHPASLWEGFARLVLEAAYEATLCAGILNSHKTGSNKVYLTVLGGGAFGNPTNWIMDAILRALKRCHDSGLAIVIVSFGASKMHIQKLIANYSRT